MERVTRNGSRPAGLSTLPFLLAIPLSLEWLLGLSLPHRGPGLPQHVSAASSECSGGIKLISLRRNLPFRDGKNCAGSRSQEAVELGSEPESARFGPGTKHLHSAPAHRE